MSIKKILLGSCCVLAMVGVFGASPASAQDFGVRAGFSVNPDQFYFGGHVESDPIYEDLRFRPNIEIGFGDNETFVGLNGEFIWPFRIQSGGSIYAGLGPAINIIREDFGPVNDTRVEPGFNFLMGYEFEENYFVELKVGTFDSPDVKFGFGYTWR